MIFFYIQPLFQFGAFNCHVDIKSFVLTGFLRLLEKQISQFHNNIKMYGCLFCLFHFHINVFLWQGVRLIDTQPG